MKQIGNVVDSEFNDNGIGTMTVSLTPGIIFDPSHFTIRASILKSHDYILDDKKVEIVDELQIECICIDSKEI